MEYAAAAARAIEGLAWVWSEPPHVEPVLRARDFLDPLLSGDQGRIAVALLATIATYMIALGTYHAFLKPASRVLGWVAWFAFVAGLPALVGYLSWDVPGK